MSEPAGTPSSVSSSVYISGIVDMETVEGLRDHLMVQIASNRGDEIKVDMAGVEIHGSAVIALLISIVRGAQPLRKKVIFHHCPDGLIAIASACGVDDILTLTRG